MQQLLRIVPNAPGSNGLTMTQGTKVLTPAGEELKGINRIVLTCDVNDVWRAEIHCTVEPTDLSALSRVYRPSLLSRVYIWARGLWRDVIGGFRVAPRGGIGGP